MPGGIDENGAFAIGPNGSRIPAILTDITVTGEGLFKIEEHDPEGLEIPRDQQTGLPDISSLLRLGALFRGMAVVVNHGQSEEGKKALPLKQGLGLLNRLIPWKRGKE